ncbi:MAG: hypothetical protein M9894_04445 [Planctomycetes bacterium]|nr:hypothetical protein [Planctomycetota bacterium]
MKKSRLTVHVLRELGVACAGAVVGAVLVGVLTPTPEPAAAPRAAAAPRRPRAARPRQAALAPTGCAHGATRRRARRRTRPPTTARPRRSAPWR